MKLKRLVEQHFHGAYGVDFNTAGVSEIRDLAREIYKEGVGYIFPTLVTDSIENIKRQISVIKSASINQASDCAKIVGVHLEGIFLNSEKKGIHNSNYFMLPTVENYKLVEDDSIKIVTLAPELIQNTNIGNSAVGSNLITYLRKRNIKVQAGHCVGGDLTGCNGTTHTFNAMSPVSHRGESTALSALINDRIYTEIIADGVHVSDNALKLLFKTKPADKILLVSDCLPCTHSNLNEFTFAGQKVFYDGEKATGIDGTLAGSTKLLPDIVRILLEKNMFNAQFIENSYVYHNLPDCGEFDF